jgi:hypothetical protein
MKKRLILAPLAIAAASLVCAAPAAQAAAPVAAVAEARVVPAACRYETRYHWDWIQCWAIFYPAPSSCYYRVYTCS